MSGLPTADEARASNELKIAGQAIRHVMENHPEKRGAGIDGCITNEVADQLRAKGYKVTISGRATSITW
ncbi:hypothetical protein H6786_01825 [Candidatus Nomurabacteria bacterium]|nr:hypothetical protein [Candidatus Nomurabacteria bacterium]